MAANEKFLLPKLTLGVPHIIYKIITEACDTADEVSKLCLVSKPWKTFIEEVILPKKHYQMDMEKKKILHDWKKCKLESVRVHGCSSNMKYFLVGDKFVKIVKFHNSDELIVYQNNDYIGKYPGRLWGIKGVFEMKDDECTLCVVYCKQNGKLDAEIVSRDTDKA